MLKFEHVFEHDPPYGDLSVDILENPLGAKIQFSTSDDGIWLTANSQGFLYLARIFAELGTRELESGYHFHRSDWLQKTVETTQEVSVQVYNGDWNSDA